MTRKLTLDDVASRFDKKGWKLLATEYANNMTPMKARCPNGHITTICWNNLQKNQGCRVCAGNEAHTYEHVANTFKEAGCELLADSYKNVLTKMPYRCVCGNESEIRFCDFQTGVRCEKCKARRLSEAIRTSDEDIAAFCMSHKCKFLRSWIQNKKTRIVYICKCGNESEAYWTNFKRFPNCKECRNRKVSGPNCHMYDPDREAVAMRKRFRKMCGQHIRRFMRATEQTKTKSTHELLGYKPIELQEHILNHPNMKNCGDEWHVDHRFPIQAFLDHGIHDLKLINHLDNLQPMPGKKNLSKGSQYDVSKFLEWIEQHKGESAE